MADSRSVSLADGGPGPAQHVTGAGPRLTAWLREPRELRVSPSVRRVSAVAVWGYAVAVLAVRVETPFIDFPILYHAGSAVLHGQPLYATVPAFWYPPFGAVFFAPWAFLSEPQAASIYAWVQVCLTTAAAALVGAHLFPRHRALASGLGAAVLLNTAVYTETLFIGNPSLLMLVPLVVVVVLWVRGRWLVGAVVLGISLAVKPLLLLLLVLPLLRRQFTAFAAACLVAGAATLLALPFVHDWAGLTDLPVRLATARDQRGPFQVYAVALSNVGSLHPGWVWPLGALRVVLAVGVLTLLVRSRGWPMTFSNTTVLAGALALCLPVVGPLSEAHYCVMALPACWCLALRRHGAFAQVVSIAAIAVLSLPLALGGVHLYDRQNQVRWALGSALALTACCLSSAERSALPRSSPPLPQDPPPP